MNDKANFTIVTVIFLVVVIFLLNSYMNPNYTGVIKGVNVQCSFIHCETKDQNYKFLYKEGSYILVEKKNPLRTLAECKKFYINYTCKEY